MTSGVDNDVMELGVAFDASGSRFGWKIRAAGGSYLLLSGAGDIVHGVRYHIVATATGTPGTMVLYINGVETSRLSSQLGYEAPVVRRPYCTIGKARAGSMRAGFAGDVTLFKMYSGAMEHTGVEAAYAAHFPFAEHHWNFAGVRTVRSPPSPRVRRPGHSAPAARPPTNHCGHRSPLLLRPAFPRSFSAAPPSPPACRHPPFAR